ncbi:MAG: hypothetical protein JG772_954 [Dysgonamonadaceae bacterium]|jgi:hypothetical protein|nr:hypothetical protein [Dysgonamonadaceae bacterium]
MPYRRLPNTDLARIRALKTAVQKSSGEEFRQLLIDNKTLSEAETLLLLFERKCKQYRQYYEIQVKAGKQLQLKAKNARIYLSHFIQVLYMCVIRSEIKSEQLALYGLENHNLIVPELTSNELLLIWGKKVLQGEELRTAKGGVPIFNPSLAKVKVIFSIFEEEYAKQKVRHQNTLRALKEVEALREDVDRVICNIWNQVEKYNEKNTLEDRLRKNREYGIIYYYRKGEKS